MRRPFLLPLVFALAVAIAWIGVPRVPVPIFAGTHAHPS
jgi:hypothetical protein